MVRLRRPCAVGCVERHMRYQRVLSPPAMTHQRSGAAAPAQRYRMASRWRLDAPYRHGQPINSSVSSKSVTRSSALWCRILTSSCVRPVRTKS